MTFSQYLNKKASTSCWEMWTVTNFAWNWERGKKKKTWSNLWLLYRAYAFPTASQSHIHVKEKKNSPPKEISKSWPKKFWCRENKDSSCPENLSPRQTGWYLSYQKPPKRIHGDSLILLSFICFLGTKFFKKSVESYRNSWIVSDSGPAHPQFQQRFLTGRGHSYFCG